MWGSTAHVTTPLPASYFLRAKPRVLCHQTTMSFSLQDEQVIKRGKIQTQDLNDSHSPFANPALKMLNFPQLSQQQQPVSNTPSPSTPNPPFPSKRKQMLRTKQIKNKNSRSISKESYPSHLERKFKSYERNRSSNDSFHGRREDASPALVQALEFQSTFELAFPSLVKLLVRSHVSGCFWMGLPVPFCKVHLPKEDASVILETESGKHYETKYLVRKTGLSAGWKRFAVDNKLKAGDVAVFHLIEATKFKVYIVREDDLIEVGGAGLHLNRDVAGERGEVGVSSGPAKEKQKKRPLSPLLSAIQKKSRTAVHQDLLPRLLKESPEKHNGVVNSEKIKRTTMTDGNQVIEKPKREKSKNGLRSKSELVACHPELKSKRSCANGEVKSSAILQAEEVRLKLDPAFPSFLKSLWKSHVTGECRMGLPATFCQMHLPKKETSVMLENESAKQCKTTFNERKKALTGGWKRFVVDNELVVGDVVVFHLVEAAKFKVYILRAMDLSAGNRTNVSVNSDTHLKRNSSAVATVTKMSKMHPKSFALEAVQEKNKEVHPVSHLLIGQPAELSENHNSTIADHSKSSRGSIHFEDITSLEGFITIMNELLLECRLSRNICLEYYELCCSQNAFLHDHLMKGISHILIAGVIAETVKIAAALRTCTLSTSQDEFKQWEKGLKVLEALGMNVGFLHARLHLLQNLLFDSDGSVDRNRYKEACVLRAITDNEIRTLEAKLAELRKVSNEHAANIKTLKSKADNHELNFQEKVSAPW